MCLLLMIPNVEPLYKAATSASPSRHYRVACTVESAGQAGVTRTSVRPIAFHTDLAHSSVTRKLSEKKMKTHVGGPTSLTGVAPRLSIFRFHMPARKHVDDAPASTGGGRVERRCGEDRR